ncbi:Bro-N domain-containing protein [Candidatus Margulisiibacteriota bacterium]
MQKNDSIVIFKQKKMRRYWDEKQELWYFSIIDVIAILTDSTVPKRYWSDLKRKLIDEGSQVYERIVQLKFLATDGKKYATDCFNTKDLLRVIQSIPSPKAEPFKQWLAKVGYERIQEIEDPELAMKRMKELYKQKGYSKDWIEKRARGIAVRNELTEEWHDREARKGLEYAILTNEIMQGTFDMKVAKYKQFKKLRNQNLRDHMDDMELILTMLGEATTTRLTKDRDSKGFNELHQDAKEGGSVAGRTRNDIEKRTGRKVSTSKNFLLKESKNELLDD